MRPVGDHALLLELTDNATVHVVARLARERFGDQLAEVVPGHETLLLVWPEGSVIPDISELTLEPAGAEISDRDASRPEAIRISVRYDGADLEAIAERLGVSTEAVVQLHSGAAYTVGFIGSAGLPYLFGEGGEELERLTSLSRLTTPRTAVPAGSVAVAAGYCCVYPRRSPGGWNLLGTTDAVLFDPAREPPALLEPGMRVRFEPGRG